MGMRGGLAIRRGGFPMYPCELWAHTFSGGARLAEERHAAGQYFASRVGDQDVVFESDPAEIKQCVDAVPVDCVFELRSFRLVPEQCRDEVDPWLDRHRVAGLQR